MHAERTVTVYGGNRLDQAHLVRPRLLADQFVQAARDGYFKEPCGRSGEWAYRLWLTDRAGANIAWDSEDDDALMDALRVVLQGDDEARDMLVRAVWGEDA